MRLTLPSTIAANPMRRLSRPILIAAALTLGVIANPVHGYPQPAERPSHLPLSDSLPDLAGVEELIKKRISRPQDLQRLQEIAETLLKDKEALRELTKSLDRDDLDRLKRKAIDGSGNLLQDPAWNRLAEQMRTGEIKLSEKNREFLERLADVAQLHPPNVPVQPTGPMPTIPPGLPDQVGPNPMPPNQFRPNALNAPPSGLGKSSWLSRQVLSFAEGLDKIDTSGSADNLSDLVRQLMRAQAGDGSSGTSMGSRWPTISSWVSRASQSLPTMRTEAVMNAMRNLRLPNMPGRSWLPSSTPTMQSFSRRTGEESLSMAIWFMALVALGVVAWKLAHHRSALVAGQAAALLQLGPWPIEPRNIRTREELTRAFEYLALLKLGLDARPCHHRELGDRLATLPGMDAVAANSLALAYEKARYAPHSESFTDDEINAARRDLCLLAGVSSS